jgi:hypothetical protein
MTTVETADSVTSSSPNESHDTLGAQLADLRRLVTELCLCEARLAAASHKRELRRLAVDVAGPLAIALTLLTAFGLANVAGVLAVSSVLSPWAAALTLAAAWIAVAALLVVTVWFRGEHGKGLRWWRALTGGADEGSKQLRAARDLAEQAVRETFERLAPELSKETVVAVVPLASAVAAEVAGDVAAEVEGDAAGEVVDVGRDLLEGSEDLVERMVEDVPGGGIIDQVWNVALMPGRAGIRIVATVLRRPPPKG